MLKLIYNINDINFIYDFTLIEILVLILIIYQQFFQSIDYYYYYYFKIINLIVFISNYFLFSIYVFSLNFIIFFFI
jgi:hypothetical protein